MIKKVVLFFTVLLSILIVVFIMNYSKLDLISGFAAKNVASAHFIDQRSLAAIEQSDNDIPLVKLASNTIDEKLKSASSTVFGFKKRTAIYREGLGAVLIDDDFDVAAAYEIPKRSKSVNNLKFPYGDGVQKDTLFKNVDYQQLNKAVSNAFDASEVKELRTRSVLVVYKDHIIAEKYDSGFNKKSVILGWSMTKSVTATVFGIMQKQGKINVMQKAPVAEWQNDSRKEITINDLLHMNSGLEWEEKYDKISDATKMLFLAKDMSKVQLEKPLAFSPNSHWNYSSGTTNLLSGILRMQFKTHQEYLDFWYSALIDKIGMHSMLVETDMAGSYVGSSYGWATTRDWAKFGLLYLHKGNWNGEQLFDKSWTKYVATPTNTSQGRYGAHFWLNAGGFYPDAPKDLYSCNGFQGQMIFIIPSLDLVIVRMGLKEDPGIDFNLFLKEIVGSLKVESQQSKVE